MAEEENIRFENMLDFKNILREDDSSTENVEVEEKEYDSLYEELIEKCKPSNFLSDQNKFNTANDIYSQLLKISDREEKRVLEMRNVAIKELGVRITINTKELYEYLEEVLDPRTYERLKPYDAERVRQAGEFYFRLQSLNKRNILELELLKIDAQSFIDRREAEWQEVQRRKQRKQEEQQRKQEEEQIKILKRQEEERIRQEKEEKATAIASLVIIICLAVFLGIIILVEVINNS